MRPAVLLLFLLAVPGHAQSTDAAPLDFSTLSEPAQRELTQVLGDEFCGCGSPHTLAACLQVHADCRHSRRLAQLAATFAAQGASAGELGVMLAHYNLSFREPRATLPIDERMCTGDAKAAVTLVEFADFECPVCGAFRPVLEKFVRDRQGKVRLCYLPFPLPQHPNAIPAGQAALFARDRGKFWPVHDALFENQKRLSPEVIRELVDKAGLSGDGWAKAAAKGAYTQELEHFVQVATSSKVLRTPTVFIDGRMLDFVPTADALQLALDDELDWQASHGKWTVDASK
ncbi:MAG TPA: thioredoxin domain-containing protein [Myxococcaceae bacterium]|nr:thioredoxin domain-containing protein [Myxococcaceae bacterium]